MSKTTIGMLSSEKPKQDAGSGKYKHIIRD